MPKHFLPRKLLFAATIATGTLAAGVADANPRPGTPLRNAAQRPANGNIGQHGQPDRPAPILVAAVIPAAVATPLRAARNLLVRALLRRSAEHALVKVERPLLSSEQRPATSNHGGRRMRED